MIGLNCVVSKKAQIGDNVKIGHNCIIEDDVVIGDNTYIDSNTIIRSNTNIGSNSFIGSNCIIGEYLADFYLDRQSHSHKLSIGNNAIIRSGSIIYTGSTIGNDFTTGHRVTIRENTKIGNNVSIGTLSDIEIGKDSLVAAGAIVTKKVNDYEVVAGNPGKVISDVRKIKNKITGENVYPWRYYFKKYMPWEESDFLTWYNSLEVIDKEKYRID